jgi:type IV pilus assembly protein PilA
MTRAPGRRRAAPSRRARRRGITLIELLLTVALVGVLAAMAMVGYRKFIYAAQSAEPKHVIEGIRGAEQAYLAENLVYLGCSATLTDYYPNRTPNDKKMNFAQPTDPRFVSTTNGWALLNLTTDAPVRFGYAVVAGIGPPMAAPTAMLNPPAMPNLPNSVPWFSIQAVNDHDGNGIFAVFFTTSVSSELFSENEQE